MGKRITRKNKFRNNKHYKPVQPITRDLELSKSSRTNNRQVSWLIDQHT